MTYSRERETVILVDIINVILLDNDIQAFGVETMIKCKNIAFYADTFYGQAMLGKKTSHVMLLVISIFNDSKIYLSFLTPSF